MKKVALITRNKILAESLDAAMKASIDLEFELILLLNLDQAILDAEIFEVDVALIDVMQSSGDEKETPLKICEKLHKSMPDCRVLILVSQNDKENREIANQAKRKGFIEDFVFYDASLKYLFAKLAAF